MKPKFEGINDVKLERGKVANDIRAFIEANGLWMFEVDGDDSEIRFQVWKDESGNPMTRADGIENLITRIKAESDTIPEEASVTFLQMAGGGVHVSVKLDKSQ